MEIIRFLVFCLVVIIYTISVFEYCDKKTEYFQTRLFCSEEDLERFYEELVEAQSILV